MDELDTQYQAIGEAAGIPLPVVHRLTPEQMRVVACLVEHRDRIVAQPELAQHVFGTAGPGECRRLGRLLQPVRLAVWKHARIAETLTHYRGKLALGMQWRPKLLDGEASTAARAEGTIPISSLSSRPPRRDGSTVYGKRAG